MNNQAGRRCGFFDSYFGAMCRRWTFNLAVGETTKGKRNAVVGVKVSSILSLAAMGKKRFLFPDSFILK